VKAHAAGGSLAHPRLQSSLPPAAEAVDDLVPPGLDQPWTPRSPTATLPAIDCSAGEKPVLDDGRPLTVGSLMRPATTTVELRAHLASAAYLMKRGSDSALVVTTDGSRRAPLGLITDWDISQAVADGRDLEHLRFRDLLSGTPTCAAPDTPVVVALRTMLEQRIHHLPVVAEDGLVGIVDMADLCRALMADAPPWGGTATR
jgi:CBS domain-containing protein